MTDERAEAAAERIVNCLGIEMRDEHHRGVWIKSAGECIASVYADLVAENERLKAEAEELREFVNKRYWERIREENTALREQKKRLRDRLAKVEEAASGVVQAAGSGYNPVINRIEQLRSVLGEVQG